MAGDITITAPDRIKEAIDAAFDTHALHRHDQHQATIWATTITLAIRGRGYTNPTRHAPARGQSARSVRSG